MLKTQTGESHLAYLIGRTLQRARSQGRTAFNLEADGVRICGTFVCPRKTGHAKARKAIKRAQAALAKQATGLEGSVLLSVGLPNRGGLGMAFVHGTSLEGAEAVFQSHEDDVAYLNITKRAWQW